MFSLKNPGLILALLGGLALLPASPAQAVIYTFRVNAPGIHPVDAPVPEKYSFNTCGATSLTGPTASQCSGAYASTTLDGQVSVSSGIQTWTVPVDGEYVITAAGAAGGAVNSVQGGAGNIVRGTFHLTQGTVVRVLVGQVGVGAGAGAGGGGGSFVALGSTPLLVGGGGGGASSYSGTPGYAASTTTAGVAGGAGTHACISGGSYGGTNGGGGGAGCAAGGGGLTGTGKTGAHNASGGAAFTAGGSGGNSTNGNGHPFGGFGGGGAGSPNNGYGGGGGGYSGGGGGDWQPAGAGGGGGSYVAPSASAPNTHVSYNTLEGYVTITSS